MKKRSYAARLGILALALTLVSTCLVGGTLAKYTTEVTGTGTAEIAKWEFLANNGTGTPSTSMTALTLTPASYSNVATGKVAPGTSGNFIITAKNGSEVDATYTIVFTAKNVPTNLKFYQSTNGTDKGDEITVSNGTYTVTTDKALTQNKTETTYVMWDWAYGNAAESDQTTIATGSYDMTVEVTVTGTQATPVKATA